MTLDYTDLRNCGGAPVDLRDGSLILDYGNLRDFPQDHLGWNFGIVQTVEALRHAADILASLPEFRIIGNWKEEKRVALWQACRKVLGGKDLPYIWQLTGSCVGAGGANMGRTGMCVEIVAGELEEYKEWWWLYTYGKSRERSGSHSPGEGSTGTGWAAAATKDGTFAISEASGLPEYSVNDGWLQLSSRTEIQWSDGDAIDDRYNQLAKKHLFKTAARMKSSDDCVAALTSGYALTQASNFGFRGSQVKGTPPVRIATWNGSWSHQTYVDEYWQHPTEGLLFRWGNNWGPGAHGAPTNGEPAGGVYISAATMDSICKRGEVFAFSAYEGFPARVIDYGGHVKKIAPNKRRR